MSEFKGKLYTCSPRVAHFFHEVSNIRPLVWMFAYLLTIPVFAVVYWLLPAGQFRIPDGGGADFGSWIYYSIVTITTLGFGDYTPAHAGAQAVTAIEVALGLVLMGLFLNAVGSMKSEIDVESEVEKQRRAHFAVEKEKLDKSLPLLLHSLSRFLDYCYAVTTPQAKRKAEGGSFDPGFRFQDMASLFTPSGLEHDKTRLPAVSRLLSSANRVSLALDSLQSRVDMTLWPQVLEDSFSFVANYQMFSAMDSLAEHPESLLPKGGAGTSQPAPTVQSAEESIEKAIASWDGPVDPKSSGDLKPVVELYYFIKENALLAQKLEKDLTEASASQLAQ